MDLDDRLQFAADDYQDLSRDDVTRILAERAAKLAQVYAQPIESTGQGVDVIAFRRGSSRYGVELQFLTEIRPVDSWTPVPGVPPYFLGVIHLRGDIIALLDLATLFNRTIEETHEESFAIVITYQGVTSALIADSVDDVHDLWPENIHPPLTTFSDARGRYIRGLAEEGLSIIDVEALLADEWLVVNQEIQEDSK